MKEDENVIEDNLNVVLHLKRKNAFGFGKIKFNAGKAIFEADTSAVFDIEDITHIKAQMSVFKKTYGA